MPRKPCFMELVDVIAADEFEDIARVLRVSVDGLHVKMLTDR